MFCSVSASQHWPFSKWHGKCLKEFPDSRNSPPDAARDENQQPGVERADVGMSRGERGAAAFLSDQHLYSHSSVRQAFGALIHSARNSNLIPCTWEIMTKHWSAFPLQMLLWKWSQNYFQVKSRAALTNIGKGPKKRDGVNVFHLFVFSLVP